MIESTSKAGVQRCIKIVKKELLSEMLVDNEQPLRRKNKQNRHDIGANDGQHVSEFKTHLRIATGRKICASGAKEKLLQQTDGTHHCQISQYDSGTAVPRYLFGDRFPVCYAYQIEPLCAQFMLSPTLVFHRF